MKVILNWFLDKNVIFFIVLFVSPSYSMEYDLSQNPTWWDEQFFHSTEALDDVQFPTGWQPIDKDRRIELRQGQRVLAKYADCFDSYEGIKEHETYVPENVQSSHYIVWIIIHGTWGRETQSFNQPTVKNQNLRHIKRAAAWYAQLHRMRLELISFLWSGLLDDDKRKGAAYQLKNFLQKYFSDYQKLVCLSHSHGGNVVNCLSHLIPPERPISLIIHFGCPVRPELLNQPKNYGLLIHFYSQSDAVAKLGKIPEHHLELFKKYLIGGSLFLMPLVIPLAQLRDWSTTIYSSALGSFIGLFAIYRLITGSLEEIHRSFLPKQNALTINISTQFDGKSIDRSRVPDFINDHSTLIDAIQYVPEIICRLFNDYPLHTLNSGFYFLNIAHSNSSFQLIPTDRFKMSIPVIYDHLGGKYPVETDTSVNAKSPDAVGLRFRSGFLGLLAINGLRRLKADQDITNTGYETERKIAQSELHMYKAMYSKVPDVYPVDETTHNSAQSVIDWDNPHIAPPHIDEAITSLNTTIESSLQEIEEGFNQLVVMLIAGALKKLQSLSITLRVIEAHRKLHKLQGDRDQGLADSAAFELLDKELVDKAEEIMNLKVAFIKFLREEIENTRKQLQTRVALLCKAQFAEFRTAKNNVRQAEIDVLIEDLQKKADAIVDD